MSNEEELPTFDDSELEEVTLEEVRESLPRIFENPEATEGDISFEFDLETITSVKVKRDMQTKTGIADMYILKSNPKIYCFRNAYNNLATFIEEEKIKLPARIKYVTRKGTGMKTRYIFEKVK